MDEVGLVVELLNFGVVGVDEIDNLLDGHKALLFLLDERADRRALVVVRKEHTWWKVACGGEADMGLHGEKICAELVDLGEVGAAVKGVDIVGREGDGSGIGSWERHVNVLTVVGVML